MSTTTPVTAEKAAMSPTEKQKTVENHKTAAKHHGEAAKHHEEAAKHHENGHHEMAAHSTVKAMGHHQLALDVTNEDSKNHAKHN